MLSAGELGLLYRQRVVSPVEAVDAILRRIDMMDRYLTAFITVDHHGARDQARAAERAIMADEWAPLLGIPVTIKDLISTRGLRTTHGSLIHRDLVPENDAPSVQRIRAAGAVVLGKTNTSEFGWKADSGNLLVGPSRNPADPSRTAGGSSGGAAAAVAAGMGPLALGSDAGGSIRTPAGFCGVVGFKPSLGRIPHRRSRAGLGALACNGPMTRTVPDAGLLLEVVSGAYPDDRRSYLPALPAGADDRAVRGWRVAWCADLGFGTAEPHVLAALHTALATVEDLGCEVETIEPRLGDVYLRAARTIEAVAQATMHVTDLEQVRPLADPRRLELAEEGLRYTAVQLALAEETRVESFARVNQLLDGYDLLLLPVTPVTAFTAGADAPGDVLGRPVGPTGWSYFTPLFNLSGHPAASVPAGVAADGLPVGMQVVGRWLGDDSVLRFCSAFEAIRRG
jgi:Asp-tRNA(Asn)/Glu-tRNA(Gln) amidotransferase A subunit family amidase